MSEKFILTIDKFDGPNGIYHDRIEALDYVDLLVGLTAIAARLVKKEREIEVAKMMDTYVRF